MTRARAIKPAPTPVADDERAARICLALMRIGTRLAAGFDQDFAAHRLTQAQFRVLIAAANLGETDSATPSALADFLFIERATISVLLKPLVTRRLLQRMPGPDARSYRVRLTAKGWSALRVLKPHAIAAANRAVAGLSAASLPRLETLLDEVEQQLRLLKG